MSSEFNIANQKYLKAIEKMWVYFQPFADSDFVKEFNDPNKQSSRYSEMFLGTLLLKACFLLKKKTSSEGPDLCVGVRNKTIWVEIITPKEGYFPTKKKIGSVFIGLNPNGERNLGTLCENSTDNCRVKICSGIKAKRDKYQEYLQNNIVKEQDCKIIAINIHDLHAKEEDVIAVLYGKEDSWSLNPGSALASNHLCTSLPVRKHTTDTELELGIFNQNSYANIAGVFSFDHFSGEPLSNVRFLRNNRVNSACLDETLRAFSHIDASNIMAEIFNIEPASTTIQISDNDGR